MNVLVLALGLMTADAMDRAGLDALNAKPGWGDVLWMGPRPESCAVTEQHDDDVYCTPGTTTIGDMPVESVALSFWKNQLIGVVVTVKPAEGEKLMGGLKAAYGAPYQSNPYIEDYSWYSANILLSYEKDVMGGATAMYLYRPGWDAREKGMAEAAKARAGGL